MTLNPEGLQSSEKLQWFNTLQALELDGSDLPRAQGVTSHLRDVSVAIIPEGAAFSFLSTSDWNKVALQGGQWLQASPGF